MNSLKDRNSVYYSYAIINFLWYALCGVAILILGSIFTKHTFGLTLETLNIQIPVEADQLTLQTAIDSSMISINSATASLNPDYIMNNRFGLYVGMMISLVIGLGLFLFGFFQLRMILKSAWNDQVFTQMNIKRLKIIAGLIIAFKPLEWLMYQLFIVPIEELMVANEISIRLNFELGSFVFGLLLFALAAVFEKGHDMYQELKLTV
ncbi:DUF2975 domain-containing protein [Rhodohalobacter barkolensis]|uniref:DUF2975 domain-containing protein n=1 Tax=Rhodohalobacter barkolensis TaxID=2053187 RepID=A0A2N0VG88_9BACT|nr:DUF2975 domain-containing protein [Rhodohalobacter barkolensis]PKD43212.1 hypothetical protein CWD77_11390 [Rhodohalobacter barkolensis]